MLDRPRQLTRSEKNKTKIFYQFSNVYITRALFISATRPFDRVLNGDVNKDIAFLDSLFEIRHLVVADGSLCCGRIELILSFQTTRTVISILSISER